MKLEAHHRWVGLVVGLLGMSVIIQGTAFWLASTDPSFAVVEDYEQKARDWDQTQLQQSKNVALGWTAELRTAPLPRGVEVELVLTDALGEPIADASVGVVAFHNARANDKLRVDLPFIEGGRYVSPMPVGRAGLWEFRLEVRRGDELFTDVKRVSIALEG